jgi:hypothetical protein
MIFFELLTYVVLSISVSFMWSFSEIFSPIRNFIAKIPYVRKPFLCPECSSFWMGILTSLFYNPLFNTLGFVSYPFCGLLVHLFACFLYKIYFKISV